MQRGKAERATRSGAHRTRRRAWQTPNSLPLASVAQFSKENFYGLLAVRAVAAGALITFLVLDTDGKSATIRGGGWLRMARPSLPPGIRSNLLPDACERLSMTTVGMPETSNFWSSASLASLLSNGTEYHACVRK